VFLDARGVDDGAALECEVCIIGAGAAGIAIARELAGGDARVVVLESGGFRTDQETQRLYEGEVVGHAYTPLAQARVRAFGGSTGHWQGWCRPLDETEMDERPWVPHSGWPLTRSDLDPFYRRAQRLCQLGPYEYSPAFWGRVSGAAPLAVQDPRLEPIVYQFSPPTQFGVVYREDLRRAANVRTLLHANATQLTRRGDGGSIERAEVKTLSGRSFGVRPRHVVLATGGIENARLLLASNVGNDNDLVGRYFAEHPHASAALLALPRGLVENSFHTLTETRLGSVRGGWATTAALEQQRRILRFSATLDRIEDDPFAPDGDAEQDVHEFGEDVAAVASSLDGRGEHDLYSMFMRAEQAPNPASRVTLGDEPDALGTPKVRLDWRLTDLDRRSVREALKAIAVAVGTARLGRLYTRPVADEGFWPGVFGGSHHMGTTRMHRDPREGVVDADCCVHGVENLYVAGSSVFPNAGYANPTLTIVALSLRLAGHLAERLS
jgi:choline dehydrogenase-like flavoprotein